LTFLGGVEEIGGNKVLVSEGDTRIFLDFGMSFASRGNFYTTPFLSPRDGRSLIELGILPRVEGVYRFDDSEKSVDAVFLSHAHMDHAAYISMIKRSIPVHCGETSSTILKALDEIMMGGFEYDFEGLEFKPFRTGDRIMVGPIEVEPIHVDHSVPGAYGFIVHTRSGAIAYTGDFRLHGSRPDMTDEFVERAKEAEPSVLIVEGTNMTGAEVSSEPEVMEKLNCLVKETPGLVLADFSRTDMDRLRSFHRVAEESGRKLAITLKQAFLLNRLSKDLHLKAPSIDDPSLTIFQKRKKRYFQWERDLLECGNVIDSSAAARMQKDLILATSFYDFEELVEIKPVPESSYILSASEPFNEEMEIDFDRLVNWLERYGLPQYHVHVSGHIMPHQLRNVVKEIGAKKVFPVHSDHPELFRRFMRSLKGEIVLPKRDVGYTV
jgi:ribonuclease J